MSRPRGETLTSLDAFLASFSRGLTGLLTAIAGDAQGASSRRDSAPSLSLHLFGVFYDFLQLYSYAMFSQLGWGDMPAFAWLQSALQYRNPFQAALGATRSLTPAITALVWALLAAFVACAGVSLHGFATGKFGSTLPLRILRATAAYVVVLQITLVERMASVFPCGTVAPGVWSYTAIPCTSWLFLLMRLSTAVLLALFLLFSLVVSAVSLNRSYAQPPACFDRHALGRVETAMILQRAALALLFSSSTSVPTPLLLLAVGASGLLYAGMYVRYLPDLDAWRNKLQACLGAAFAFTALCSAPAVLLPQGGGGAGTAATLLAAGFYAGLPGAMALAYIATNARLAAAAREPGAPGALALTLPTDVEVVARCQVDAARQSSRAVRVAPGGGAGEAGAAGTAGTAGTAGAAAAPTTPPLDAALVRAAAVLQRGSLKLFPDSALMDCLHANFVRGHPRMLQLVDYGPLLRAVHAGRRGGGGGHPAARQQGRRQAHQADSKDEEASARAYFEQPPSAHPHPPPEEVELALLNAGLTKPCSLDVRFLLVKARQEAQLAAWEAGEGSSSSPSLPRLRLTAIQEVQVRQLVQEASVHTVRAVAALGALWRAARRAGDAAPALQRLTRANRGALQTLAYLRSLAPGASPTLLARGVYQCSVAGKGGLGGGLLAAGRAAARAEAGGEAAQEAAAVAQAQANVSASAAVQRALSRADAQDGSSSLEASLPARLTAAMASLPARTLPAAGPASPELLRTERSPFYAPLRARMALALALAVLAYAAAVALTQHHAALLSASTLEVVGSGDRHVLLVRMARRVARGAALAGGALRPAPPYLTFSSTLSGLAGDASALLTLHRSLFATVRASGSAAEAALYTATGALRLSALAQGAAAPPGAALAYSSSLGDGVLAFAAAAAGLAGQGQLQVPAGNFTLRGQPREAFAAVDALQGLIGEGAAGATALVGGRLAAQGSAAEAAVGLALWVAACAPLLLGAALLLPPTAAAAGAVEGLLAGLQAAPQAALAAQASHSQACLSALLEACSSDSRALGSLLQEQGGLSAAEASEAVALAQGGGDDGTAGSSTSEEPESSSMLSAPASPPPSCCPPSPRLQLTLRPLLPLLILLIYTSSCLAWSLGELAAAGRQGAVVAALAELRAAALPPATGALAALSEGLTLELWQAAPQYATPLPPACNVTALSSAAAAAAAASARLNAALEAALQPATADSSSSELRSLLLGGGCAFVAAGGGAPPGSGLPSAPPFLPPASDLGLPPLDCSGGLAPGAPSGGAYFGLGGSGLAGLTRAYSAAAASLLPARARSVAAGASEAASFLLSGGGGSVTPPATDARRSPWPCPPPLLDAPSPAWQLDAALHQLVEPGVRGAQGLALAAQAARLQGLLVAQSVTAALMAPLAAAAYLLLALPVAKELDELTKVAKWMQGRVGGGGG